MSQDWLKPALLGVQQPAMLEGHDGDLGALLARVTASDDVALGFSRGVGVLAACSLAAVTTLPAEDAAPAAAPPDARQLAPHDSWIPALADAFAAGTVVQGHEMRLQHEACLQLSARGATLPSMLLPVALDAGLRSTALRPALLPVLGARGRWLAERNPEWKYAAAGDGAREENAWTEGTHLDRLAWFRTLRANDAAAARDLLANGLAELPAKERLDFVEALDVNLSAADETLLEPLLKDRSKDVRAAAASLLARLPVSAHAQRLAGWLAACVRHEKKLFGTRWNVEAPESSDAEWAAACVDAKRPPHDVLGERAWWLYQLVRQVPLRWWCAHTGMTPAALVEWARKSDWKLALHRGWRERAGSDDGDWIDALLREDSPELNPRSAALLALLPARQRERHWPADFDALCDSGLVHHVIGAFAPGETLSADFSKALAPSLAGFFGSERLRNDYSRRNQVLELAALLHPATLRGVATVARQADETPAMADCALAFERIVRTRLALATPS